MNSLTTWWQGLSQGEQQVLDVGIFAGIFGVTYFFSKSWKWAAGAVLIVWVGSVLYHSVNNSNQP